MVPYQGGENEGPSGTLPGVDHDPELAPSLAQSVWKRSLPDCVNIFIDLARGIMKFESIHSPAAYYVCLLE
jgi:hypothetical protein